MNSDYETYKGVHPQVDADAFVHESAQLVGDVHLLALRLARRVRALAAVDQRLSG